MGTRRNIIEEGDATPLLEEDLDIVTLGDFFYPGVRSAARSGVYWSSGGTVAVFGLLAMFVIAACHWAPLGTAPARAKAEGRPAQAWAGEGNEWGISYGDGDAEVSGSYGRSYDEDRQEDGPDGDDSDGDGDMQGREAEDAESELAPDEQEIVDLGLEAAKESEEAGDAAADQAAKAGSVAAKEAKDRDWGKEDAARLASIAAKTAGLAAGMPSAAAKTAGMLAAQALSVEPTPPPKPIPARVECRTAVPVYEQACVDNAMWAKNTGIHEHPDWYEGLTADSPLADFQAAAVKAGKCKYKGCPDDGIECLPDGYGCVSDAVSLVKSWLADKPVAAGTCKEPQMKVQGHCLCPPQYDQEAPGDCKLATEAKRMSFYMYRAQSDYVYPMENVNLADLPGVMWYLQKEVVASVPRKYNVTRILRYLVTMKNPDDTFKHVHWIYGDSGYGKQFAPFGAFDSGKCTATNCMDKYEEYGYAVGCQAVETEEYNYKRQAPATNCVPEDSPECVSGTWYSLPGACPHETLYHKSDECNEQYPSARCDHPDGSLSCTYNVRYAGQVELDELEGISDYEKWWVDEDGPTGNIEYEKITDDGNGTAWWNERHNEERCNSRMAQVVALFGKRYPDLPDNLPDPPCL